MSNATTRKAIGHAGVVEQVTILPAVRTRGVQAEQRHALPRLLEEDAMVLALDGTVM
jgi:hypothetical protein